MVRLAATCASLTAALALGAAAPAPALAMPSDVQVSATKQLYRRADSTKVDGKVNETLVSTAIRAIELGQRPSWVQGTHDATLLELQAPSAWNYFTGDKDGLAYGSGNSNPQDCLPVTQITLANAAVGTQDSAGRLCSYVTGEEKVSAGASMDSMSCAVSVLLAAVETGEIKDHKNATDNGKFTSAAAQQLDFVLNRTPCLPSGAISQRTATQELWSDGIYMASTLGLYGVVYDNKTLLQEAYNQMKLYREGLLQPNGLLAHIVNITGTNRDPSVWTTGNGWGASGFLRVLTSIAQSSHATDMLSEVNDLYNWTKQILASAFDHADPDTGLLRNHLNDTSTFLDAAGSALLSYAAFRVASMAPNETEHIAPAEKIYQTIQKSLGPAGELLGHIDTVNVLNFYEPGPTSPEALSFILLMTSARRDYAQGNVTGLYGPGTSHQYPPTVEGNGTVVPGPKSSSVARRLASPPGMVLAALVVAIATTVV